MEGLEVVILGFEENPNEYRPNAHRASLNQVTAAVSALVASGASADEIGDAVKRGIEKAA